MKKPIIVGIGEILWDIFDEQETLGGAPVNFAYYANALGADGFAVSAIGDDDRGKRTLGELKALGVSTRYIRSLPEEVTGYVRVSLDRKGVASYMFPDDVAWDNIVLDSKTKEFAAKIDAVCFGSLAQRSKVSRQAIAEFIGLTPRHSLKVFDLNLRQQFYSKEILEQSLRMADVVKLNDEEIEIISQLFSLAGDMVTIVNGLLRQYELQLVVLTLGGNGSLLVTETETSRHPGYKTAVVDTIGAGDSFTAAAIVGFLEHRLLDQINENANRVASYVCTQQGAVTVLPEKISGS